jgi:hypothetical protein
MKVKMVLVMVMLAAFSLFIFSMRFEYLDPGKVMVVPNEVGSPMMLLSDGSYYVRDWNITAGCYQLTKIGVVQFNFAVIVDDSKCN